MITWLISCPLHFVMCHLPLCPALQFTAIALTQTAYRPCMGHSRTVNFPTATRIYILRPQQKVSVRGRLEGRHRHVWMTTVLPPAHRAHAGGSLSTVSALKYSTIQADSPQLHTWMHPN